MVTGIYPSNLEEALNLKFTDSDAKIYAGGTDWMVRHDNCSKVIFINQLTELKEIYENEDNLYIGSGCTYIELLEHDLIPELLKNAIKGIAAPAIRNVGTIGGNICNASPAGDTLPVLYAYDAKLVVVSNKKERIVPIEDFILGVRKLSLLETEIVKQIIIPKQAFTTVYYEKVGARRSQALSKLSFVGLADINNGVILDLRIAFGSVSTTIVRQREIEKKYIGRLVHEVIDEVQEIKKAYDSYVRPIDDQRSTAIYRKKVCMNLLEDFIKSL